jgi:hypothetical protein
MRYWIPALAISLAVLLGCETDSKPDPGLSIDPPSMTLNFGEEVTLTAQGGWDYTWEIREPRHGSLSSYNGKRVTYRAPEADLTSTNALVVTDTIYVHSASNHTAKAVITVTAE